uniref:Non-specific protein-tyrosine kinase n=1 Tax=Parastrongyloides trichosuri TaxID=131310 RepID=A0A0N4Z0A6_PARTI
MIKKKKNNTESVSRNLSVTQEPKASTDVENKDDEPSKTTPLVKDNELKETQSQVKNDGQTPGKSPNVKEVNESKSDESSVEEEKTKDQIIKTEKTQDDAQNVTIDSSTSGHTKSSEESKKKLSTVDLDRTQEVKTKDKKKSAIKDGCIDFGLVYQHVKEKYENSCKKLDAKSEIFSNKEPYYIFEKEYAKFVDIITPKKLIKIDNYNNYGKRDLNKEPYYVGIMDYCMASHVKIKDGQFFVRRVDFYDESVYIITTFFNFVLRHYLIMRTTKEGMYYIKNYCFNSVQELIRFHLEQKVPIKNGIFLYEWTDSCRWQLSHNQIQLIKRISSCSSGHVFIGTIAGGTFGEMCKVAAKVFHFNNPKTIERDKNRFVADAGVLINMNSKYIVNLLGIIIQNEPFVAIFEYMPKGTLHKRLQMQDDEVLTPYQKRLYCKHVALGLNFLHKNSILHQDICSKNVYIGKDGIAKLSNLGFSCGFYSCATKSRRISIRWMPPETLQDGKYDKLSESWCYGVFVYEVYSNGKKPYHEENKWKDLAKKIITGRIKFCNDMIDPPEDMRTIAIACGELNGSDRPSMNTIISMINIEKQSLYEKFCLPIVRKYNAFIKQMQKVPESYENTLFKMRADEIKPSLLASFENSGVTQG